MPINKTLSVIPGRAVGIINMPVTDLSNVGWYIGKVARKRPSLHAGFYDENNTNNALWNQ